MPRLDDERQRLYLPRPQDPVTGHERAAVLALSGAAAWEPLSAVWRGVQEALGLPAPGIAVSGSTAIELWFSWQDAVPAQEISTFFAALQRRWLADVPDHRLQRPDIDAAALPPRRCADDQWSAFVTPDLAPLFADTPWLDLPPSDEGQAHLMSQLRSITAAEWRSARAALAEVPADGPADGPTHVPADAAAPTALQAATSTTLLALPHTTDPQQFLLSVMNDDRAPLALRIEAAKALL